MSSAVEPTSAAAAARHALVHPLDAFYARRGLTVPPLEAVDGEAVPEPYKTLLVHDRDMTSSLEAYHGRRVHLRLISRQVKGDDYFREVLLVLDGTEKAVEFGAIHIHLARFPEKVRALILEERLPLGRLLNDHGLSYVSRPKAYLRLASDLTIDRLLNLRGAHILFGRRNTLSNPAGEPLAEIVEILPPATPPD
jgi:chorismate-pyruvate lyase